MPARYFPPMAGLSNGVSSRAMIRRFVAFALWAYFGWYAAAYVLSLFGMPTTLAPIGAAVMVVIAAIDWPALVRASTASHAPEPVESSQRTS
jgi:hypothetical protein